MEYEKIFVNHASDKIFRLISRIYGELLKLNNKRPPVWKWAKDLNRYWFKEDKQVANKHTNRCSTSWIIREMQIKTTVRCHLVPIKMVTIKRTENSKCWYECGEIGTLVPCWWECKMVKPLWKMVWWFLKKLNIKLPYDPAIPFLGINSKELKAGSWRDICTSMFIALFTKAKR